MYILNKHSRIDNVTDAYHWHKKLDHINKNRINRSTKGKIFDINDYELLPTFESCLLEKMIKSPFTGKGERASDILSLVYTDVCGCMNIGTRGGYYYFITFTDDRSRFGYVYLMKYKSEVFDKFKEYQRMIKK